MAALRQFPWPGNVRELKHVIERAILASPAEATEISISLGPTTAAPAADVSATAPMKGFPPDNPVSWVWDIGHLGHFPPWCVRRTPLCLTESVVYN